MKPALLAKLKLLNSRYKDLEILLNDPQIFLDQEKLYNLSKEYGQLSNLITCFRRWVVIKNNIISTQMALEDSEIHDIAQEDLNQLNIDRVLLEKKLKFLLESKISHDIKACFCEIRAGTGGHEAALFAGQLIRMYMRYAEKSRWKIEVINTTSGEQGGYKEIIVKFLHIEAYKKLQFESGGHRVQRVPHTESQGRIHTSSCTIAVIPELTTEELPIINQSDLRIDTFRSSGAGGQHVNTTDSAIRITHLPTGIVVACQDARSQHKNRAKALEVLRARLSALELKRQQEQSSLTRRNLLGTGDRSDRIRTYNFHQNRVTDHRIGLTIYCLHEVMEGDLDILILPIIDQYTAN